ncbi:MAG TPA: MBL fold metallo-hydrolase [Holophagaceae bacterium]|jgi:glyoxylase-like metal-dependent hydrolase (beta-lactamase superfamily II)/rhodanese-related sulfurtransferase|nr:MBL fold metallo-hydrolase [Holophagaceae bacterium]
MLFRQLNDIACKTYLVASEPTGEAAVVDPLLGREDHYLGVIKDLGLKLRYVVDTHVHADHLSGAAALRDRTGADHVMHRSSKVSEGNLRVEERQDLELGDLRIGFLHTPGHTQDSLTLRLPDRILTGDFLFLGEGGAGRTDLPGGDPGDHWDSLRKLEALSGDLLVFPGHDYHQRSHSTLAEQRRANPRLQPRSREAYIAWLRDLRLAPADWMNEVLKANLACTRDPRSVAIPAEGAVCEVGAGSAAVPQITCEEFRSAAGIALLIDVRQPDEFTGPLGHIEGARLIPLGELPARLAELEPFRNQPVVTNCKAGGRSNQATTILLDAGFTDVRSLTGGMGRWNSLSFPVER